MLSAKWHPFCLSLNVLKHHSQWLGYLVDHLHAYISSYEDLTY